MDMSTMTTSAASLATQASSTSMAMPTAASMSMSMGGSGGCKFSMLLNWTTIDACFLFSKFHIRSSFGFFAACLGAALLVISLEFLRRLQREFDRYLRSRHAYLEDQKYVAAEDMEEKKLLVKDEEGASSSTGSRVTMAVMLEQGARGFIHMVQFGVSYCIMLLFMYSNGYIIISILFGTLIGFALFTRDTLYSNKLELETDDRDKTCC